MDRLTDTIDRIAGIFLGVIALVTFTVAVLRYVFNVTIPDWFNLICMLQGIAIFWGIASTTYEERHISVDGLYEMSGPRARRAIDVFAAIASLVFLVALACMLVLKVRSTYETNQQSADLGVPLWPFFLVASAGIWAAALLAVLHLRRVLKTGYHRPGVHFG